MWAGVGALRAELPNMYTELLQVLVLTANELSV